MESSLSTLGPSSGVPATADDFLIEYRAISNKLKKRFLRRPNVAEANEQFTKLSKRLRENDQPQHEAMCHLAIARCEQSVGNTACEAEALVAASRAFLQAERKIKAVCCPSIEDHLTAAIHTYGHAIRLMDESGQSSRAAGLCHELGSALRDMEKTSEAVSFYQRAADISSSTILEYLRAKMQVAECLIDTGDFHSALTALSDVSARAEAAQGIGRPLISVYSDYAGRCEVLRLLLLLLIEPTSQNISPSLSLVLEKYAWQTVESTSATSADEASRILGDELFLLLQSLVMAVQVRDAGAVIELEDYLAPKLDSLQRTLLRRLSNNVRKKSLVD